MYARLVKVYCYSGMDKQVWWEAESVEDGQGIAWSPSRWRVVKKAEKTGYMFRDFKYTIKFYRSKAS